MLSVFYLLLGDAVGAGVPAGASGITIIVAGIVPVVTAGIVAGVAISAGSGAGMVVPEFLRTLVFARPRGDDQFADCTFSPSLDMSR